VRLEVADAQEPPAHGAASWPARWPAWLLIAQSGLDCLA
jgi:hypothetical protein